MNEKLTVGSCFSGIGGLELGLEWTGGFETKWQVEWDEYASRVLAKHWPNVTRYKDIRDVVRPEPVDLICGGFPCQDVSLQGKRAGLEGKRSTLWSEMFRLICEVKPRWVLAENVRGLLSSDDGRFFGNIFRDLASCGYDAEWNIISASAVGADHQRERIFILAYPTSDRRDAPILHNGGASEHSRFSGKRGCPSYQEVWRLPKTRIKRDFDGLPHWVDRLKCLGNAVVPPVAQAIGEMILKYENK